MSSLKVLNQANMACEVEVNEGPHDTGSHFSGFAAGTPHPAQPAGRREELRDGLEQSGYRFVGLHRHAANKICDYTKKSILGKGHCYKQRWYGMESHRCVQCTVSLFCMTRCAYCWRSFRAFMGGGMANEPIDSPELLVDGLLAAQQELLSGFGGNPNADQDRFAESKQPSNFAISLVGESILYPRLAEFLQLIHARGATSYLVTKGTYPEGLAGLLQAGVQPTNLYISLCAPDPETFAKLERPVIKDAWERQLESLRLARRFSCKRMVRITSVKGWNMQAAEEYAKLIQLAMPEYIEVKGYSHVGDSQQRLPKEAMPSWEEMKGWAMRIANATGYVYTDEFTSSRVILLCRDQNLAQEVWDRIATDRYLPAPVRTAMEAA